MPYRHAHWYLLSLMGPMILVAFWPAYFSTMRTAPFAFHAHGLTASLWLLLIVLQSWSAHAKKWPLHRASGRAVFAVVPLFAAGGTIAIFSMAQKFADKTTPFYAALGARLGMLDMLVTTALVALVALALYRRRRIAFHAACMLATALMVLPPVIARLPIPRLPLFGDVVVIALALWLASRQAKGRAPFLFVAGLQVVQVFLFALVGPTAWWSDFYASLAPLDPAPFAVAAAVMAEAVLIIAWRYGTPVPRQVPPLVQGAAAA